MRIIDNNKDYYDYLQGVYPDDTVTFDRRDSYNLTKQEFADSFYAKDRYGSYWTKHPCVRDKEALIILQVCNKFWLFLLTMTEVDDYDHCKDYSLQLLHAWSDYGTKRERIKLYNIKSLPHLFSYDENNESYTGKRLSQLIQAVESHNYKEDKVFNKFIVYRSGKISTLDKDKEEKHIPILKNIGIAAFVDPNDIYFALDEYFSLEKTAAERTESVGLTNNDRIEMHGFDLKTSFRGKK